MTMSTTKAVTAKPAGGCGGDGCDVRDPWPLLKVRHRGDICRLCTSCVLKYHPGSFCILCFALLDAGSPVTPTAAADPAVVHCIKCRSVSHLGCLPNPDQDSQFVCPSCKDPERFSYFLKENADGKRRVIDIEAGKVLSAASRLSANSMTRVAVAARAEAERKVREAVAARKRAREMLEMSLVVHERETERSAAAAAVTPKPGAAEEPRRKGGNVGPGGGEQKRVQRREIEKWMRFHEPLPIAKVTGQVMGEDISKVGTQVELKSRVPSSLGQEEKETKGNILSSQSSVVKDEEKALVGRGDKGVVKEKEKALVGSGDKGPRLPQATQDALVSRTDPRSIYTTSSPSTAGLHS